MKPKDKNKPKLKNKIVYLQRKAVTPSDPWGFNIEIRDEEETDKTKNDENKR